MLRNLLVAALHDTANLLRPVVRCFRHTTTQLRLTVNNCSTVVVHRFYGIFPTTPITPPVPSSATLPAVPAILAVPAPAPAPVVVPAPTPRPTPRQRRPNPPPSRTRIWTLHHSHFDTNNTVPDIAPRGPLNLPQRPMASTTAVDSSSSSTQQKDRATSFPSDHIPCRGAARAVCRRCRAATSASQFPFPTLKPKVRLIVSPW
ncbi:hypothetical protein T439DRAFT_53610 [Meredithblackwellia eburnea MCA 4105]